MQAEVQGKQGAERGQSLVEFALILPAVLLLMVGGYNVGRLLIQFTEVGYIAQATADSAARAGGYSQAVVQQVDEQLAGGFLAGAPIEWHLETRTAGGDVTCRKGACQCTYGESLAMVLTYKWQVDAGVAQWHGTQAVTKYAACWRGTDPYGGTSDH